MHSIEDSANGTQFAPYSCIVEFGGITALQIECLLGTLTHGSLWESQTWNSSSCSFFTVALILHQGLLFSISAILLCFPQMMRALWEVPGIDSHWGRGIGFQSTAC